jgi:hypothetical protein
MGNIRSSSDNSSTNMIKQDSKNSIKTDVSDQGTNIIHTISDNSYTDTIEQVRKNSIENYESDQGTNIRSSSDNSYTDTIEQVRKNSNETNVSDQDTNIIHANSDNSSTNTIEQVRKNSIDTNESDQGTNISTYSKQYTYPNMTEEVPILKKYCDADIKFGNRYHCRNLERVMFRAANTEEHGKDYYFKKVTGGITDLYDNYEKNTKRDIVYHIKHIMDQDEPPATIIQTCHDFENVCNKYYSVNQNIDTTDNN